ncbi:uridylate kinase [Anopheles sinensis]|uniref:Uridylate kinase n=1 Tax=Anopheles sinensis TaxID=74873 RepID=A0A084WJR1_ANOSI|nr:uridylate kinase [Anopheles sinensis]
MARQIFRFFAAAGGGTDRRGRLTDALDLGLPIGASAVAMNDGTEHRGAHSSSSSAHEWKPTISPSIRRTIDRGSIRRAVLRLGGPLHRR